MGFVVVDGGDNDTRYTYCAPKLRNYISKNEMGM